MLSATSMFKSADPPKYSPLPLAAAAVDTLVAISTDPVGYAAAHGLPSADAERKLTAAGVYAKAGAGKKMLQTYKLLWQLPDLAGAANEIGSGDESAGVSRVDVSVRERFQARLTELIAKASPAAPRCKHSLASRPLCCVGADGLCVSVHADVLCCEHFRDCMRAGKCRTRSALPRL